MAELHCGEEWPWALGIPEKRAEEERRLGSTKFRLWGLGR